VPAPAKPAALYRDWLVMLLCRPFFKKVVYHWHAAGLTEWLEQSASPLTRWVTWRLLGRPELSIVLSDYNAADGKKIGSLQTRIVHNGIPDPCADFEQTVLPARRSRLSARRKLLAGALAPDDNSNQPGADTHTIRLLYLSLCSREKGLFDILEAVAIGNQRLSRSKSPLRLHLSVAGEFVEAAQKDEFERRIGKPDLQMPEAPAGSAKSGRVGPAVEYLGFLSGQNKRRILIESDCLCFPTYYHAESFGLVLIEAMAFGLPIVATRWRSIPEVLPNGYAGLVDIRSPEQIANAIEKVVVEEWSEKLRGAFLAQFTLERHLTNLAGALSNLLC
jgi:glycosyltransferase involved in cell wall biosynthesis